MSDSSDNSQDRTGENPSSAESGADPAGGSARDSAGKARDIFETLGGALNEARFGDFMDDLRERVDEVVRGAVVVAGTAAEAARGAASAESSASAAGTAGAGGSRSDTGSGESEEAAGGASESVDAESAEFADTVRPGMRKVTLESLCARVEVLAGVLDGLGQRLEHLEDTLERVERLAPANEENAEYGEMIDRLEELLGRLEAAGATDVRRSGRDG